MAGPSPPNGKRKGRGKGGDQGGGGGGRSKAAKKGAESAIAPAPSRRSGRLSNAPRKNYAAKNESDDESNEEAANPPSTTSLVLTPRVEPALKEFCAQLCHLLMSPTADTAATGPAAGAGPDAMRRLWGANDVPRKKAPAPRATKKAVAIKSGDDAMGDAGDEPGDYFLKAIVKKVEDITGRKFLCESNGCHNVACVIYALSNSEDRLGRTRNIPACLDCQMADYGGWPRKEVLLALKFKYLPPELRAALLDLCTKFPDLRDMEMPDLLEFSGAERTLRTAETPGGTKIFGKTNLLEYLQQRELDDIEKFSAGARKSTLRELDFAMTGTPEEQMTRLVDGVAGKKVKPAGAPLGGAALQQTEARIKINGGMSTADTIIDCFSQWGRCRNGCMGFRAVPEDEPYSYLYLMGLLCGASRDGTASQMVRKLSMGGLIVCFFDKDGNRIDDVNCRRNWERNRFMVKHVAISEEWATNPPDAGKLLVEVFPPMTDGQIRELNEDPSKMRTDMRRA